LIQDLSKDSVARPDRMISRSSAMVMAKPSVEEWNPGSAMRGLTLNKDEGITGGSMDRPARKRLPLTCAVCHIAVNIDIDLVAT
jgi:hypothetical protein